MFDTTELIETNLQEISTLNPHFVVRFFTTQISVLKCDYQVLTEAVLSKDIASVQCFLWKYGVNAVQM
jgi:hypothetical protein